ncbi:MAG TPA: tetratricopeptide repeat protein [Verrucomicrobiae bacterium]|nr:tetratricopeptide repeat protein [Verrucomicrobiae bacterium]
MPNLFAEQLLNQAGKCLNAREFVNAERSVNQALAMDPKNIRGLCFKAIIAAERGHKELALTTINWALKLGPRMPAVLNNAATVFFQCGQPARAHQMWQRLVQVEPQSTDANWNLAMYHVRRGDTDDAETYLRKVMQLAPSHPNVCMNLGNVIKNGGRIAEAVEIFREGARRHPQDVRGDSNLLYALHFDPAFGPEQIHREHAAWGRAFEATIPCLERHENDRSPTRRLRVGYVSPNLRAHVIGHNLLPLFRKHDHNQFQIYCYSDTQQQDGVTDQLRAGADEWRETAKMSDTDLAKLISQDKIDVLIDLVMHMEGVRLGVFARKPSPVQVTWMAYPGSTGLTRMDYRLTDAVLDPPGESDHFYTEQSIRLETFWCYEPPANAPAVGPLPADANGYVTFGCLNNFGKVNSGVLEMWREVLSAVPGARLMVLPPKGKATTWLLEKLQVEPARVECLPRQAQPQYFALYNRIDLALDPFPYTGHTTTLDGLWMGVPLVTLVGSTVVSRGSLSLLSNLGLSELAVATKGDYVTLATNLANDLPRLRELRAGLRERLERSVLMDADRFARQVELAYRMMWRKWCEKARQ